ncbi:hypothetical protein H4S04_007854, partial [Coemansia sp. S16]
MLSAAVRTALPQSRPAGLLGGRSVAQTLFGKHMSMFAQAAKSACYPQKWASIGPSGIRAIHSSAIAPERNRNRKSDGDVPVGFENFLKKSPKRDDSAKASPKPEAKPEETPNKSEE